MKNLVFKLFFILVSISGSLLAITPEAPSNLILKAEVGEVQIAWSDNSSNENGFKIFRDGELIALVGENETTYIDKNITGNRTYTYTIKATTDTQM